MYWLFFLGQAVFTGQTKPNFSGRKIVSYKGLVVISYLLPSEAIHIVSRWSMLFTEEKKTEKNRHRIGILNQKLF